MAVALFALTAPRVARDAVEAYRQVNGHAE
jgi:hypothetical protein